MDLQSIRDQYREPTVSREIHGVTYTSTKVPATAGLRMLSRAVRLFGEEGLRVLLLASAQDNLRALAAAGPTALVGIMEGLDLDPNLPRDLVSEVKASRIHPAGDPGPIRDRFDQHFRGELPHLFEVCAFVLAHNLLGFTLGSLSTGGSLTDDETGTEGSSTSPIPSEE